MTEKQKRIVAAIAFWILIGGTIILLWWATTGGVGSCLGQC